MSYFFRYLIRRCIVFVLLMVAASVVIFTLTNLLPGSPAQVILGTGGTASQIAQLNRHLGYDRPLLSQYWSWISSLLTGHLGVSFVSSLPIGPQITQAAKVTIPLLVLGLVFGVIFGVGIGLLGALSRRSVLGMVSTALSQVGLAVPSFALGVVLINIFAVHLHLLPSGGFVPWSSSPWSSLKSLLLPGISLGVVEAAIIAKYARIAADEVLHATYFRAAIAKGMRFPRAFVHHGIRNVATSLLTVVALEFVGLLVGAVVVENVFTLPGLGTLLLNGVTNRDLTLVQDLVMVIASLVFFVTMVLDLAYHLIDPRVSQAMVNQ